MTEKKQPPIYTRQGDKGMTSLAGGARVRKDDVRVEAYGSVDELITLVAVARGVPFEPGVPQQEAALTSDALRRIEADLMVLAARLASVDPGALGLPEITSDMADTLEREINAMTERAGELSSFIIPGGTPKSAALHYCRTVCRRAERRVVTLAEHEAVERGAIIYLNRLSDWFFTAARYANAIAGVPDEPWVTKPRKP